jgi:hypothetical protein
MSSKPSTSDTAKSFNKILALPRSSSRVWSATDLNEAVKKLRRLILVDGIPSETVGSVSCSTRHSSHITLVGPHPPTQDMEDTLGCDRAAGKHLSGVCLQGALRGQREDQERYLQVVSQVEEGVEPRLRTHHPGLSPQTAVSKNVYVKICLYGFSMLSFGGTTVRHHMPPRQSGLIIGCRS